jgi:hypothetical protein
LEKNRTFIKMPELLVFVRALALGFLLAEVTRIAYIGGSGLSGIVEQVNPLLYVAFTVTVLGLVALYAILRGIVSDTLRLLRSLRIDLLLSLLLGGVINVTFSPFTQKLHEAVGALDPTLVLVIVAFLFLIIVAQLVRSLLALIALRNRNSYPMNFLTDEEIDSYDDDVFTSNEQAVHFAQTVLASGSGTGLVYGVDGPWGIGKTSFINLASNYWRENAANNVIVVRFEPLRYASDSDLAQRLIRDLSAEIQRQVFVPEFRPVATRYSRMLKEKTDLSFFGFKLAFNSSVETVDELLQEIDDVLIRIDRRLIVVVDDLDRLEPSAVNNVLFTVRRTFKLTQAAYILCYDTENLLATNDDEERARQFLEKFVNIKLSLFVDSSALCQFLREDWDKSKNKHSTIPSETMLKLASILSVLADLLEGEHSAKYMFIIGDMRKLKRFVNAILLMQIEKTNLSRTDFNRSDLINLMLLHLNYPGIFRRIYLEETEGRSGFFSIRKDYEKNISEYINEGGFIEFVDNCTGIAKFLLNQLFKVESLELGSYENLDESVLVSRACFNQEPNRNLEKYLKLIVRFASPAPLDTFKFYQDAVIKVISGISVSKVLSEPNFNLNSNELAHDEFWRVLIGQSHEFNQAVADDSINTLIRFLPKYSSIYTRNSRGLRSSSIYNLVRLLDRAGWGRTDKKRLPNSPENIIEIAYRIYGEDKHTGQSLIDQLSRLDRGVLGLENLMLFRLQCSADRQGQIYNLHNSLIIHDDIEARTTGLVSGLAITGMRTISQRVFSIFKSRYIDVKQNLFDDIDGISNSKILGTTEVEGEIDRENEIGQDSFEATRSMIKSFIVYQLINRQAGSGSGVGCGYYDLEGTADNGQIAVLMNDYLFEFCFNPEIKEKNAEHFLDYCLRNFTSEFWAEDNENGYHPSPKSLTSELISARLVSYWTKNRKTIMSRNFTSFDKRIVTLSYIATYKEDLPPVFEVLDQIKAEAEAIEKLNPDNLNNN